MKRWLLTLAITIFVVLGVKSQSNISSQAPEIYLKLSDTIIEFAAAGGYQYIKVKTNAPSWQMSGKFFWCTKAYSDTLIELECKVNLSDNIRSDKFYVNAGNLSKKVEVIQKPLTPLEKENWKRGLINIMTNVTLNYENGKYKGEIFQKKEQDGNRIMKFNFKNGLGAYQFLEKDSYFGEFELGDYNGKGMFIIARGAEYQLPYCSNCRFYVGNWVSDMKSGLGKCYDKTGKLLYQGIFNDDKPKEKYPQSNNNTVKFEYIEYSNLDKYLGETKNGKKEGLGILFNENGDAWYGEWKDDKKNGKGIELMYNGSIKTGKWKDNTLIE